MTCSPSEHKWNYYLDSESYFSDFSFERECLICGASESLIIGPSDVEKLNAAWEILAAPKLPSGDSSEESQKELPSHPKP